MHDVVPLLAASRSPTPETWREEARCRGIDGAKFFPMTEDPQHTAPAKAICGDCPVMAECLVFSVVTSQPDGIWGGLTSSERTKLANRLGRQGWTKSESPQEAIELLVSYSRNR